VRTSRENVHRLSDARPRLLSAMERILRARFGGPVPCRIPPIRQPARLRRARPGRARPRLPGPSSRAVGPDRGLHRFSVLARLIRSPDPAQHAPAELSAIRT
jgi:hypothetical protein